MAMTQYGMPPAYCPERAYHTSPAAYALGGNGYTAPMVRAQSQPLDRVVSTTTADNLEQAAVSAVPAEMDWSAPTWEEQMGMRGFLQQHHGTQHPAALSTATGRSIAPPHTHAPTQGFRGRLYSPPPVTGPYHYKTRNGLLAVPAAPCFASRPPQAKPCDTSKIYPDPHAIPAPIVPVLSGRRPIVKSKATVADAIRRFEASMGNTDRTAHHRHPSAVPASRGWRSVRRVLDYVGARLPRSNQQIDRNSGQIAGLSQTASRGAMIRISAVLGSPFIPRRMPARRRRVWGADRWQEAAEYVHEQQAVVQQQQQQQGQAEEVAGTVYDSEEEDYDSDFSSELDPSDYSDDAYPVSAKDNASGRTIDEEQRIPPIAADAWAPVPFIFMPPMPYRALTCRDLSGWAYGAAVRSIG